MFKPLPTFMTLTWHQAKIDEHAAILIADPSIPAYRNDKIGPGKLLMVCFLPRYCEYWVNPLLALTGCRSGEPRLGI
jgi:hypothetical protein